ncbi:MAG: hypothetical protein EOM20_20915 [Spartobacteria bacterium]|nr:hypothetical protein [Spartobacteria bacterium]
MTEQLVDIGDVTENDIVFNCPACGKSLAIDRRGAGLLIACSDCGEKITVPVPEDMLDDEEGYGEGQGDFDEDIEEGEADANLNETGVLDLSGLDEDEKVERILELEQSLAASQSRVQELVQSLQEVYNRRNYLEDIRVENLERSEKISRELALIQDALDRIVSISQEVEIIKEPLAPITLKKPE